MSWLCPECQKNGISITFPKEANLRRHWTWAHRDIAYYDAEDASSQEDDSSFGSNEGNQGRAKFTLLLFPPSSALLNISISFALVSKDFYVL
jgi:hypothetical protein